MDEGAAAVLAALIAVAGVALGLFGARWQARGMQEQANAAIEAVKAQGRDQNAQWRRTVRRDVWVEYLGAVDEFRLAAGEVAGHLADEDLPEAELGLEAAHSRSVGATDAYRKIELEGPEQIVSKGYALQGVMVQTIFELEQALTAARAMGVLEQAGQREQREVPSDQHRPIAAVLSSLRELRGMESDDPGRTEYGQRLGLQILALDLLSASDTTALVFTYAHQLSLSEAVERYPHGRWQRFHEVRTDFVQAARSHLDGNT
ncbi:hypothetical protein [Streptomyces cupreus]|uniref:Uncharacterized protein n=1 Tax=Streptomyces cupreus TaxID=2759956 RepID=A0A7X1IYQ6_9ACTN|nr:hypothetical protein [Streptomyces cupreus]MBC2901033.1 hypothetical protein [Streptomyces cupreus]